MRRAAWAIVGAGALWALLCLKLGLDGHAPSVTLVPIPKRHYYLAQAAFVVPLLLALWGLCTIVAQRVAERLAGAGTLHDTARGMAPALALPIVVCIVLPDLFVYLSLGFGALAKALSVTAPAAAIASVVLATRAVRKAHALATSRAFVAALSGVLTQAFVGGIALR